MDLTIDHVRLDLEDLEHPEHGMETAWFPDPELIKHSKFVHYSTHDDFSMQASMQGLFSSVQVGAGRFDGKLLMAQTGQASVYIDYSNLPLEKELNNRSSDFVFAVTLDQETDRQAHDGSEKIDGTVCVFPPGGEIVRISPPELTELIIRVEKTQLMQQLERIPWLADWFWNLKACTRVASAWLAKRLRADILLALEGAIASRNDKQRSAIDRVVILSLVHGFALEYAVNHTLATSAEPAVVARFLSARAALLGQIEQVSGESFAADFKVPDADVAVEGAFAECIKMGPLAYARVVRLHHARRHLLDKRRRDQSIEEIAAEEGFWEWGRFATYYREQFGERPSETRNRIVL